VVLDGRRLGLGFRLRPDSSPVRGIAPPVP
jgi:hypothetical protein